MRITNNMVSDRVLADLQARYGAMADTQLQISTGRSVNKPSDDPTAAARERLRLSELSGIKGSQSSVAGAQSALNASESSMEGVRSVLSRANELALAGANGSLSQADRITIANEIDQLIKSAKDSMNTKVGDTYIFSGTKSDVAPYADASGDTYQGDGGALLRDGGAGVVLQTNPSFVPAGGNAAVVPLTPAAGLGNRSAAG